MLVGTTVFKIVGETSGFARRFIETADVFVGRYLLLTTVAYVILKVGSRCCEMCAFDRGPITLINHAFDLSNPGYVAASTAETPDCPFARQFLKFKGVLTLDSVGAFFGGLFHIIQQAPPPV